jgi:hypothetical protein
MSNRLSTLIVALAFAGSATAAQSTPPAQRRPPQALAPPAAKAAAKPAAEPAGQPLNIRVEMTISDQAGTGSGTTKIVTLIVADRQNGVIRSRGRVGTRDVVINVDARPTIARDGSIRMDLGLEYQPVIAADSSARGGGETASGTQPPALLLPLADQTFSNLNQRIGVVLKSGEPLVVSQSADPGSARQIKVEIKATILK